MMRVLNGLWIKGSWTLTFIGTVVIFLFVYTALTRCDEWKMLTNPKTKDAAFASITGVLLGFSFPVLVSVAQHHQFSKFFFAALSSAVLQLILYVVISAAGSGWRQRMNEGDVVAGKWFGLWWSIGGLGIAAVNIGT